MPTGAPTYAPPVVVALNPTSIDSPQGSATFNGYVTFPPNTNVSYHYEYSCSQPFSNPTSSPNVAMVATGGTDLVQVRCCCLSGRKEQKQER